jgi:hypothetical protein
VGFESMTCGSEDLTVIYNKINLLIAPELA